MDAGDGVAVGTMPFPDNDTNKGLFGSFETMRSDALRVPVAAGVKVNVTAQVFEGVIEALLQVSAVFVKSAGFAPVSVTALEPTVSATLPLFRIVTVCALLVVLLIWSPTATDAGDGLAVDPSPVPVSETEDVPPT